MAFFFVAYASPSYALCSGASLQQEFREADLVIRARLTGEISGWNDAPDQAWLRRWGNTGLSSRYTLRVREVFKGHPDPTIALFMEHDSGAYYPDMDKDDLLFLKYRRGGRVPGTLARGTTYVRFACGQSKPWEDVRPADLAILRSLSTRTGRH